MVFSKKGCIPLLGLILMCGAVQAAPTVFLPPPPGEGPALADNLIDQADIAAGNLSLSAIRKAGGKVFTTPFNRFDGMGDGPVAGSVPPNTGLEFPFLGNRPTLQNDQTTMLRISGLDAQTCLECHTTISRATVPFTLGIGGHGGINTSPMVGTGDLDAKDTDGNGITDTTGRVINPPFMFGAGGVELVAKEMTSELQAIKALAQVAADGEEFDLIAKGVDFGTVTSNGDGTVEIDISNEHGVDEDLVIKPFGRKGENFTVRDFDRGAMAFHFGIQADEIFPNNIPFDADGDGITEELSVGEMSALSVFLVTTPRPKMAKLVGDAVAGEGVFHSLGCVSCHIPEMQTDSNKLTQSFPDIANDPSANVFMEIDLSKEPMLFKKSGSGVVVPMFADLKRHNMGPGLAETTGGELDPFFTTARLWGIADSAPYLHDGRAATLTEAILAHGGEAEAIRNNFAALPDQQKIEVLVFLRSLKVPDQNLVDKLRTLISD